MASISHPERSHHVILSEVEGAPFAGGLYKKVIFEPEQETVETVRMAWLQA